MASGLVPSSTYHPTSEVPREVFQPLLELAQRGFDINDLIQWYQRVLLHVNRTGAANAEAAYNIEATASDCPSTLLSHPNLLTAEDYPSSRRATMGSIHSHVSPKTQPAAWPVSRPAEVAYYPQTQSQVSRPVQQDYEAPGQPQIAAPQQMYESPDQLHVSAPPQQSFEAPMNFSQAPFMSATYSPSHMIGTETLPFNFPSTTSDAMAFTGGATTSDQWYSPDDFNMVNDAPTRRHTSPSPPYQTEISNTQMPVLVPSSYEPPPPPTTYLPDSNNTNNNNNVAAFNDPSQYQYGGPKRMSTPMFYTPVTILPSRKRRRMLHKGVKKIMQPLQRHEQSA